MKKNLKQILLCTAIFFALIFIITFLISSLVKGNLIDSEKSKLILKISSIPIFFLYSFFIGKIIKKRGLLIGITLTIIYLSISISILNANKDLNILNIIFIIIKTLSLNFGAIIGVNRNYKKASLQTN
ncbi:unknown [Firmicutes bacterium CAG:345]|nr:unknown [Firmicutes bacterium CAG:345]